MIFRDKVSPSTAINDVGNNNVIAVSGDFMNDSAISVNGNNNNIDIQNLKISRANIQISGNRNKLKIGPNCTIEYFELFSHGDDQEIIIDEGITVFNSLKIYMLDCSSKLFIDKYCTFDTTRISLAEDNNFVTIGRDCMFAKDADIFASDFHSIIDLETGKRINFPKGIEIGNHVWIGDDVRVLKNVTIGDNCVLASGSLVNRNIPENSIGAGVPVDVVRRNITWSRERLKE